MKRKYQCQSYISATKLEKLEGITLCPSFDRESPPVSSSHRFYGRKSKWQKLPNKQIYSFQPSSNHLPISFSFRSGSVCLDVINQTWSPMYDLINIFEIFLPQLLLYPNPTDPLNPEAAQMQLKYEDKYKEKIKEYVLKYA